MLIVSSGKQILLAEGNTTELLAQPLGKTIGRFTMLNHRIHVGAIALAFVTACVFANVPSASAAKKMSYEEAFAKCKAEMDAPGRMILGQAASAHERSTIGAGCMKKYGYRLKKGAQM